MNMAEQVKQTEETYLIYITLPDLIEATELGRQLVEKKLAAGVNILPQVTSFFFWQEEIKEKNEVLLLALSSEKSVDDLISFVQKLHSYILPCIICFRIDKGLSEFIKWITNSTSGVKI